MYLMYGCSIFKQIAWLYDLVVAPAIDIAEAVKFSWATMQQKL